jgi:hypothetical protein
LHIQELTKVRVAVGSLCRFRHPLGNSDIHWVDPVIECLGVVSSFI